MFSGHDLAIGDLLRLYVPQKSRMAISPLHSELLIEIAIIDLALPANIN